MVRILLVGISVLLIGYLYIGFRLAGPFVAGWLVLAVPFLLVLALPLTVWGRDRREYVRLKDLVAHGAYAGMGLITYLVLFTTVRDLVLVLFGFEFAVTWVGGAVVVALALGGVIALTGPKIKRVTVTRADLPPALDGFRIAQISDLHIGGLMNAGYVRRVVTKTNALNPNLVAMTGDIGDGDSQRMSAAIQPLAELMPRDRVYYVSGNHEYYWNISEWLAAFRGVGARVLANQSEMFNVGDAQVCVAGIPDKMGIELRADPKPDLVAALKGSERADFKILLSHRPGPARRAADAGYDLQLSGHTHGGQFFPWTLAVRAVHEFTEGLHQVGRMWIYVSHGTGTWGPPLRLGTTPEVTLLTLRRA